MLYAITIQGYGQASFPEGHPPRTGLRSGREAIVTPIFTLPKTLATNSSLLGSCFFSGRKCQPYNLSTPFLSYNSLIKWYMMCGCNLTLLQINIIINILPKGMYTKTLAILILSFLSNLFSDNHALTNFKEMIATTGYHLVCSFIYSFLHIFDIDLSSTDYVWGTVLCMGTSRICSPYSV